MVIILALNLLGFLNTLNTTMLLIFFAAIGIMSEIHGLRPKKDESH
jgi:hypothetical protein